MRQGLACHLAGQRGGLIGGYGRSSLGGPVKDLGWNRPTKHLRWRCERPHVADMEYGRRPWRVGQARARTELVRVDILEYLVEPQAVIQYELVRHSPRVVDITPELPAKQLPLVVDVERRVDRRQAARIGRVERLNGADGRQPGPLAL